jgi:hypothetical protein
MIKNIYAKELEIYVPCHSREDLIIIKEIVDCRHTVRMEEIEKLDYWIFEKQNKECFVKISNIKDLTPNKAENKVIGRGIFIDILPLSLDIVSNAVKTKFVIDDFKEHCNTESMFEKTRELVKILSMGLYLQERNKYSVYNEIVDLKEQLKLFISVQEGQNFSLLQRIERIEESLKPEQKKEEKLVRYKPIYKGYSKDGCDYECPVCKGSLNIYQFFNSKKLDYCCPYCETLFVPD